MSTVRPLALVAGSVWWCLHPIAFDATSFNPNTDGDPEIASIGGRFLPFDDVGGRRVPTKYLADHPNGAFAETLLREGRLERQVTLAEVRSRRLVQLALVRTLHVADLTEPGSDSTLAALLGADARAYPALRSVAATLHATRFVADDGGVGRFDGIAWPSRQLGLPGMNCVVLFGDRVAGDTDLRSIESLELEHGSGLARLRAAAVLRQFALPYQLGARHG